MTADPPLLEQIVGLVRALLERELASAHARGALPAIADRFTGTYVPEALATAVVRRPPDSDEHRSQRAEFDRAIAAHFVAVTAALSVDGSEPALLATMFRAFGLSPTERRVVLVLLGFEAAPELRQPLRFLSNDAARMHPDVALLHAMIYVDAGGMARLVRELSPDGVLTTTGLIESVGPRVGAQPLLARAVRIAPRVFELAAGVLRVAPTVAAWATLVDGDGAEPLLHTDALALDIDTLVRGSLRGPVPILVGADGSGRRSLLVRAAATLGRPALVVRATLLPRTPETIADAWTELTREATLFGALLVLEDIDAWLEPGEATSASLRHRVDALLDTTMVAIACTAGKTERRLTAAVRGFATVGIPPPDEGQRITLWRRSLPTAPAPLLAEAAGRYPITGGVIARAATVVRARHGAATEPLTLADLHHGLRSTMDVKLGALGVRIHVTQTWADLVLPDETLLEMREFISRVKHRRLVYETWGFDRKVARGLGLSALFSGPPGTGKTMVAGIIANELGLDLYQVDLSRVVSKYVGETESNLANLFDAAESGHAVILFDEADSLFAKRTEVKSSVDRYANLEVNYLLQRLESFRGITILTTNFDTAIDEAFRRRLSLHVAFPVPDTDERLALWKALLPTAAAVAQDLALEELAVKYAMTGGYIRNAVLRAAFLAADQGTAIAMDHLNRACILEYASMGKVMSSGPVPRK